ncbi:bifunctional diguanylate cyclase/phosphodiesterase [Acaryochloris sp. IP29b_bin.137]|uniref:bifunctional diguanylate cyclase/phosphodiesterase n=1 Tax=Acaryochloris sp. IP29b_bin.137 TaxID=2969217 RepID=UPI00260DA8BD|nr:bifunctional diguanylate cyclase/phosphodiesterase [Acaryochloris sp. IP29b_bin.137]
MTTSPTLSTSLSNPCTFDSEAAQPAVSDLGIGIIAPNGQIQQANQTFCDLINIPHHDLMGCHYQTNPHLKHLNQFSIQFQKLFKGELEIFHFEINHQTLYGQRLCLYTALPVRGLTPRHHSLCLKVQPILLDQDLQHSTLLVRSLAAEAANDGILIADATAPEFPIIYASEGFYRFTGYQPDEVIGQNSRFLQGSKTNPDTILQIRQALHAQQPFEGEILNYLKTGESFWNLLRIRPLTNAKGEVEYFVGIQTNITQQKQTEERLRQYESIFNSASSYMALVDTNYIYLAANSQYSNKFNKLTQDIAGQHIADIHGQRFFAETMKPTLDRCFTGEKIRQQDWFPTLDQTCYFDIEYVPYRDQQGTIIGAAISSRDITRLKETEDALRESQQRFQDFAAIGADLFWETNADLRFTYLSEQHASLTGFPISEWLGRSCLDFYSTSKTVDRKQLNVLLESLEAFDIEFECEHADGTTRILRSMGKPVFSPQGFFCGYRGIGRDITEAQILSKQLRYQATHDALTGLVNRNEFENRLSYVLDQIQSIPADHALCFLDLDQFKIVNDTVGHLAGDVLLEQVADVLQSNIRQTDILSRLGGDEFGLFLENCSLENARIVTEKIVSEISRFRFVWEGQLFKIGVSIGVVPITSNTTDLAKLFAKADVACYSAKNMGRNRVHFYHAKAQDVAEHHCKLMQVSTIRQALEENRFRLFYQPIVPLDIEANIPTCYEILLRLQDSQGKILSPGSFIPAAERYGLMLEIDKWVIKNVLYKYGKHFQHQDNTHIAINLSGSSLNDDALLVFVQEQLEQTQLEAQKICFEITETVAISNFKQAIKFIEKMKELGCQFALDDFGSGFSSFSYLKRFPVDYLKIDGSLVKDIVKDSTHQVMVSAINQICRTMGIKTIAEFVENGDTIVALEAIGVDYLQGYALGKPQPLVFH